MKTIILDSTLKSLQAVMSGAAATTNPDFTASWADNNGTTFTEGSTDGALNGVTAVALVAAPAASTRRTIKSITIQNRDTAAVTITLQYNNNATLRQIVKVTLAVNDTFTLENTYDANGNMKTVAGIVNLTTQVSGVLPVANGGSGVATSTGANSVVLRDANVNISAANHIEGYSTTATAAGTTTLTVGSNFLQYFTGSTTQTVVLPVTSTLALGQQFQILNESSGVVTVQSSGANNVIVLGGNSSVIVTCILTSGTSASSWDVVSIGYINVPQNSQSAAYTTVLSDAGKHILHPAADTTARIFTIDSNANVPYPIGTAITFINQNAGGVITIAITTDTMRLAGAGTTGSRTLAANGIATATKITSTEWIISGVGLS